MHNYIRTHVVSFKKMKSGDRLPTSAKGFRDGPGHVDSTEIIWTVSHVWSWLYGLVMAWPFR